jgi:hypothetical protein
MKRLKSYLIGLAALAMALSTANAEELWEHYFKDIMNSGYMVTGTPAGMIAFKGRITLDEQTALDAYAIDLEINGVRAKALCVADFPKFPMLATCERGEGIKDFIIDVRSWSSARKLWF